MNEISEKELEVIRERETRDNERKIMNKITNEEWVSINKGLVEKINKLEKDLNTVVSGFHNDATELEKDAMEMMKKGNKNDAYKKLELSKSLRTAANYMEGVSS